MTDEGSWPNTFLAGVPKAGTTSLYRYLGQHPEIYCSPEKETYFFNRIWDRVGDDPEALAEAREEYLALFADAGDEPVRAEGTPGYFVHPAVPERIADTVPEARFLVSLRDPVERVFSEYLMNRRNGVVEVSFGALVDRELAEGPADNHDTHLARGLYAQALERFHEAFGEDHVHLLLLEDLKEDPLGVLESIAAFLDVDPGPMADVDYGTQHNPYREPRGTLSAWILDSDAVRGLAQRLIPEPVRIYVGERVLAKRPEKPTMDPDVRRRLEAFYAPELERLEEMVGRPMPELRASWVGER